MVMHFSFVFRASAFFKKHIQHQEEQQCDTLLTWEISYEMCTNVYSSLNTI
jgi:hypothetical protein